MNEAVLYANLMQIVSACAYWNIRGTNLLAKTYSGACVERDEYHRVGCEVLG